MESVIGAARSKPRVAVPKTHTSSTCMEAGIRPGANNRRTTTSRRNSRKPSARSSASPAMPGMRGASLLPLAIRQPNSSAAENEQEKKMAKENDRAKKIAALNDKFRKGLPAGGRVYLTRGVNEKGPEFVAKALAKVIAFDEFTEDNDPHHEHDFGSFKLDDEKLFWKIDYYDLQAEFGSEDPSDPKNTLRVMTIMLAEE